MEYRRFGTKLFVRMDPGEEVLAQLEAVCTAEGVRLAEVKALGALSSFTVGLFDTEKKLYTKNTFRFPSEITSLWGTVTTQAGRFYPHIHLSAADAAGRVYGGHLNEAVVSATCEMVLDVVDGTVERRFSEEVGLNLFRFVD